MHQNLLRRMIGLFILTVPARNSARSQDPVPTVKVMMLGQKTEKVFRKSFQQLRPLDPRNVNMSILTHQNYIQLHRINGRSGNLAQWESQFLNRKTPR